jgi:hypothetical protein
MTERLKVTVLKTVVVKATVGSNPTPSATMDGFRWMIFDWITQSENHQLKIKNQKSQLWGGARVAEWARLLSECRGLNLGRGFESRPPRCYTPKYLGQP